MKLHLAPSPKTAPTDNGIGRVLHAMGKYLPAYGVSFTDDPNMADVIAFHAGTARGKRVDVLHCHGLYWTDLDHSTFSASHNEANKRIIDAARRAKIITVPSDWVAEPFRRDMRIDPLILGHGIETSEWIAGAEHWDYILWNKNRPTDVCDPTPALELAKQGLKVVSTFGPKNQIATLKIIGQLPFDKMQSVIERAELYLATAPETFGIGTLEAMICGIPVLGYDWCGTRDLVKHKETGWLVPVGDIQGLVEGAHWLKAHRKEIGANAREFAKQFDWSHIVGRYYDLYKKVMAPELEGVSVVITNYNYGQWLPDAINSCLAQTVPADEIIVVDDGSTDNSLEVLQPFVQSHKVHVIAQKNLGVAAARNAGIKYAIYPLIVCLDADDMIAPSFISTLRPAMEKDRGLGIAYTGLKFISPSGHETGQSANKTFSWEAQTRYGIPPPTCIPSGSMFRRSMWERVGGYKQKYAPGEDTEFWVHGLSVGFTAELISTENLFLYRGHTGSASRTLTYKAIDDNKPWIKDKFYPMGAPSVTPPRVKSYFHPVISIIIPLGPGHEHLVDDAIQSIIGQTVRDWELILVDDTGNSSLDFLSKIHQLYPFIRFIKTKGKEGAGKARNAGLNIAKGKMVLFLDADDWLRTDALDLMLQAYVRTGHYVFSDFYAVMDGASVRKSVHPYNREYYLEEQVIHSVTALVPLDWAKEVGGFDPDLPGWEEYDFYMKMAIRGFCGVCIAEPLLYYRIDTGTRRKTSQANADKLNQQFAEKFGGAKMAGCCGNGGGALLEAKQAIGLLPRRQMNIVELPDEVRMEFTGTWLGPVRFQVNGRHYYGAATPTNKFINAPKEDVPGLLATGKWQVILPPTETMIVPEPVEESTEPDEFPPVFAEPVQEAPVKTGRQGRRKKG